MSELWQVMYSASNFESLAIKVVSIGPFTQFSGYLEAGEDIDATER